VDQDEAAKAKAAAAAKQQQVLQGLLGVAVGGNQAPSAQSQLLAGQQAAPQQGAPQAPPQLTQQQAIDRVIAINPDLGFKLQKAVGIKNQADADDAGRRAFTIRNTPEANQSSVIMQNVTELRNMGSVTRANKLEQLLDLPFEERNQQLEVLERSLLTPEQRLKPEGGSGGLASAKTEILGNGTTIQALPSGEVQVRNPSGEVVTGQARLDALKESQEFRIESQRQEAGVAVSRAREVATATKRADRVSKLKSELSERNRNAARQNIRLNQALKAAASATQGTAGAVKLQLGKLLPGVDVGNEAILDQSLKQLAVDQLQSFKGPTTDFEFGVVESTTGAIGDPKTANIARLKSLQRATWFQRRELEQFSRHTKTGGDPDTFAFNFGEPIKTKKGVFTLQDIQDTAVDNNFSIEETIKRLNQ
jgi:hypothetical protein